MVFVVWVKYGISNIYHHSITPRMMMRIVWEVRISNLARSCFGDNSRMSLMLSLISYRLACRGCTNNSNIHLGEFLSRPSAAFVVIVEHPDHRAMVDNDIFTPIEPHKLTLVIHEISKIVTHRPEAPPRPSMRRNGRMFPYTEGSPDGRAPR